MPKPTSNPILIDKFWESVPSAWRQTRSQIRHIAVEKFQMTEEQFQVLRRIRKGSASVSALAEASLTSRSAVSKTVDALVRRGLVTRSQDPNDRRNVPLALTDEGQRVMDVIFTEAEAWLSTRFEHLNPEELETLLKGMETLRKAFSNS
ncbi:MAG: MarR family winged helix-turn-helix transcriptional regulator [Chloroflexi bacterium]|nr:MarR family winged helix-turn-helix transcriptional regulator [Chloroflexota bacterium]